VRGSGTVVRDKRINTWSFLWWQDGKRKSKSLGHHPTKASACKAARPLRDALETKPKTITSGPMVKTLIEQYRAKRMPKRQSTRQGYNAWLNTHILPKWGDCVISDVKAEPVEVWLDSLTKLSPKSRVHIRGLLRVLWDYAQFRGDVPLGRNPMELVKVEGASKRQKKPRSLTVKDFQKFAHQLEEPFKTMALCCVCFGLRISECLALKFGDVDWLNGTLRVERGIVRQIVDDVKTDNSERLMTVDAGLLAVLKAWKQSSQFSANEDWIFASPVKLGRLPWSYKQVWLVYKKAASAAGIGSLGTHSLRHTFRSWLDAVGTGLAVQQKLMRHASITTTMNQYGDVVTDEMSQAASKVAGLAMPGRNGLCGR